MKSTPELHFIIGIYRERLKFGFTRGRNLNLFFALSFQETGKINAAFDPTVWDQFHRVCIHSRALEDGAEARF